MTTQNTAITPAEMLGTVAIVSGAAGGIGRRIVVRLADLGARVVAVDNVDGRPAEFDELGETSLRIDYRVVDVTDPEHVDRVVTQTESSYGSIDRLVNAAGLLEVGETTEVSSAAWAEMFAVNATGVFLMIKSVLKGMKARRRGSIVTVSSNASTTPRIGLAAYCASKAAASMFTQCAGLEAAPHGVRCNVVAPGSTDTAMLRTSWRGQDLTAQTVLGVGDQFRLGIPLGRIAETEDIVDAVEFLLSDRARHITMQQITVDGGATLGR